MTRFIRILLITAMAAVSAVSLHAINFSNETLNYRVTYKWGLINKNAGTAKLTLTHDGHDLYTGVLTARSDRWADRIYSVRDTLISVMKGASMRPLSYEKKAHEDGKYSHDVISYSYTGDEVTAECIRYRLTKKGEESTNTIMLPAPVPAVDMLSIYYYVRLIPFEHMNKGEKCTASLFSGKRKEQLTVIYDGRKQITVDDKKYDTFQITFTFTTDGKTTSAPMTAWIMSDGSRIPVKVTGELPIGKVHVLFTGRN